MIGVSHANNNFSSNCGFDFIMVNSNRKLMILKSNRKKSGAVFTASDFLLASELIEIEIERLRELADYCQIIDSKKTESLLSMKVAVFASQHIFKFEDNSLIYTGDPSPLALCFLYIADKTDIRILSETIESFTTYIKDRIESVRILKEITEKITELLKERRTLLTKFKFSLLRESIPDDLAINKSNTEMTVSKEKVSLTKGDFNITLDKVILTFKQELLVKITCYFAGKEFNLPIPAKESELLLFSNSFYNDCSMLIDNLDAEIIMNKIKIVNAVTSA